MNSKQGQVWLDYPLDDVFQAGIHSATLPSLPTLSIVAKDEVLALGSSIRAQLNVPVLNLGLDCRVTGFMESSRIEVLGKSKLARLGLAICMDRDDSGTRIDYSVELGMSSLLPGKARALGRSAIDSAIPEFIETYKRNVMDYLRR